MRSFSAFIPIVKGHTTAGADSRSLGRSIRSVVLSNFQHRNFGHDHIYIALYWIVS